MEELWIDAAELIDEAKRIQGKLYAESYDEILSFDDLLALAERLSRPKAARLITAEDFETADDGALPCWKESRKPTRRSGWDVIVFGKWLADKGSARYWTAKPTEEQRKGTEWDG